MEGKDLRRLSTTTAISFFRPASVTHASSPDNNKSSDKKKPRSRNRCCHGGKAFFDAVKAMGTRLLFLTHAIIAVWRVVDIRGDIYWWLAAAFGALLVETVVVLAVRRGREWKWLSPCVLCYLLCVVPAIWILEVDRLVYRVSANASNTVSVGEVAFYAELEQWIWYLEQAMLILIIMGRWLLPKGDLSRDQLSALLLLYVAVASDIVDFFSILTENEELKSEVTFVYLLLATWTWSLLQFAFVHTATAEDSNDDEEDEEEKKMQDDKGTKCSLHTCVGVVKAFLATEAWAVSLTMVMQDGPFLIVRLVAVVKYSILANTMLFFLTKNILVLILQTYRLVALYREHRDRQIRRKEEASKRVMKALYRHAFAVNRFKHLIPSKDNSVQPTYHSAMHLDVK